MLPRYDLNNDDSDAMILHVNVEEFQYDAYGLLSLTLTHVRMTFYFSMISFFSFILEVMYVFWKQRTKKIKLN